MMYPRFLTSIALALALGGCALTSRGSAMQPRYFSADIAPATPARSDHAPAAASAGDESMVLRLGKIRAGTDLKEEIVYRTSSHELGFYEEFRWAERPEVYLRRGLVQALYSERGLKQALTGAAPTLDVELVTFEEVRGEQPAAHVSLMVALHDDRVVRYFRTVEVTRPLKADDRGKVEPAVLARTLTEALQDVVRQVSDDVVRELGAAPTKTTGRAAENGPLAREQVRSVLVARGRPRVETRGRHRSANEGRGGEKPREERGALTGSRVVHPRRNPCTLAHRRVSPALLAGLFERLHARPDSF